LQYNQRPMSRLARIVIIVWIVSLVLGTRYVFGEPQDFGPNQHFEYIRFFLPLSAITSLFTIFYFRKALIALLRNKMFLGVLTLGVLLLVINALNAFRSDLAFFWLGFCLLTFLATAVVYKVGTINKQIPLAILNSIIVFGLFEAVLGLLQAALGHSLGLTLLGEPIANDLTKGVAKLAIGEAVLLRPFGTFPHSNVLGGMLIAALAAYLVKARLFPRERISFLGYIVPGILLISTLLTYSRSSWLAALILIIGFLSYERIRQALFPSIAVMVLAVVIGFPGVSGRFRLGEQTQQIVIRENLSSLATGMIRASPWWGVGSHNFVAKLDTGPGLETYEKQPVHNSFLLASTELGLVTLVAAIVAAGFFVRGLLRKRNVSAAIVAISLLPILLLDHYLLTLFTGIGLLALYGLILLISNKFLVSRETKADIT
jgi:O-antigen ligase